MNLDRLSIELTNRCLKGCSFCYNHSQPSGETRWTVEELESLLVDCGRNGVRAVSFGGGEPLEFAGVFDLLQRLEGVLFRSLTTHGLLLTGDTLRQLQAARPDKVHISIHFPEHAVEVDRVLRQVRELQDAGLETGINLLVARSKLSAVRGVAEKIRQAGIGPERVVYLPMRGVDTPSPREMADIAGNEPFQSMTCLTACGRSPRFCSVAWDKTVAWCSYTESRRPLPALTYAGIVSALDGLGVTYCGGADGFPQVSGDRRDGVDFVPLEVLDPKSRIAPAPSPPAPLPRLRGRGEPQVPEETVIIRVQSTTPNGALRELHFRWPDGAVLTADYPAAHSMDTRMHAVDREGNVVVLFAYLDEYILDRLQTLGPKFEFERGEEQLAVSVRDAQWKSKAADEAIYGFRFNSQSDPEQGQYVASRLPQDPEVLREAMLEVDPGYQRRVHFPWLSFDNIKVLDWPPRPPKTVQEWTQLVDAATDYWLESVNQLKHAERTQSPDLAYWQTICDRQWKGLEFLEQELARRQESAS